MDWILRYLLGIILGHLFVVQHVANPVFFFTSETVTPENCPHNDAPLFNDDVEELDTFYKIKDEDFMPSLLMVGVLTSNDNLRTRGCDVARTWAFPNLVFFTEEKPLKLTNSRRAVN